MPLNTPCTPGDITWNLLSGSYKNTCNFLYCSYKNTCNFLSDSDKNTCKKRYVYFNIEPILNNVLSIRIFWIPLI